MFIKGLTFGAAVLAATLIPGNAGNGVSMAGVSENVSAEDWKSFAAGHDFHWPGPIIAMGDIHSDARNAMAILYKAGIIDEKGHWAAGNTMLVQIGDIVDRGPDTRLLYAFFRRLRAEAAAAGGRVHNLLGNHDVMQVCSMLNYVHPQDFDSYGTPAGRFFAFSSKGEDGQDIRSWDVALMANRTLFVHAGVAPEHATLGIQQLNDKFRASMVDCQDEFANNERGPVWNRVFSLSPEGQACRDLVKTLDILGAERMVVGHTIQDAGVRLRCAGRLILADTGASRFINNNPTLVQFEDIGKDSTRPAGTGAGEGPSGVVTELALDVTDFARHFKGGKVGIEAVRDKLKLTKRVLLPPANAAPWSAWKEETDVQIRV